MNRNTNIQDELMAYLSSKYTDDSFTFDSVYGGGIGADRVNIYALSANYPSGKVSVSQIKKAGDLSFMDNYLGIKYGDMIVKKLEKIFETFCGRNVVFFFPEMCVSPADATSGTTFEEFIGSVGTGICFEAIVYFDVSTVGKEEVENCIKQALAEEGFCAAGRIYFETDLDTPDELSRENYFRDYVNKKTYEYKLTLRMDGPGSFCEVLWMEN